MQASLGIGTAAAIPGYGLDAAWSPESRTLSALIQKAIQDGIRHIDTSAGYADAEILIGRAADLVRRLNVRISTKLTPGELESGTLACSLQRLALERIDTLLLTGLLHSEVNSILRDAKVGTQMAAAKHLGQISRSGASTYGADAALCALEQDWCDVVQVEHGILNPSVVQAILPHKRPEQSVVVRSVLCKGLLTGRRHRRSIIDDDAVAILNRLETLAVEWGYELPQLAIRFALDTAGVDTVLVGIGNEAELSAALSAARYPPLTPAQMDALSEFDCSMSDWSHPERWPAAV